MKALAFLPLAILGGLAACSSLVHAQYSQIDETFVDGLRVGASRQAQWFATQSSGTGNLVVADASFASGQAVRFYQTSSNGALTAKFIPTTLATADDYIEISATVRYTSMGTSTGPTIGLYNSGGTYLTADTFGAANYTPILTNDIGYKATKYALASTGDVKLSVQNPVGGGMYYNWDGTVLVTKDSSFTLTAGTLYTVTLRLTLAANLNDLKVSYSITDGTSAGTYSMSYTASAAPTRTFDEAVILAFGGMNGQDATMGEISVVSKIALARFQFENAGDDSAWSKGGSGTLALVGNASSPALPVQEGRSCLQYNATGTGTRYIQKSAPIQVGSLPTTAAGPRRVKMSLGIRSEGFNPGDIVIRVLEQYTDTSNVVHSNWLMNPTDGNFLKIAPSSQWVALDKIGHLLDTTTRLYLYVYVLNNSAGTVWIDDLSLTQVDTNAEYLMEAVSGVQNNIFQSDTSATTPLVINMYDNRSATLGVTVVDHAGNAATPTQATVTTLTSKSKQVVFNEKGYYKVTATATPATGTAESKSWTAGVIGSAVSPDPVLGFFGVNSDSPMAAKAGTAWNRVFLMTDTVQQTVNGGVTTYYYVPGNNASAQYLYGSGLSYPGNIKYVPADQRWIICLRGVPNWLMGTPVSGHDRQTVPPWKWQWQMYNSKPNFVAYMTWVLKDLPASVEYIEAINEPEWSNWGGTWVQLADYIKAIKEALDAANTAEIASGKRTAATKLKLTGPTFAHVPSASYPDNNSIYPPSTSVYQLMNDLLITNGVKDSLDAIAMHCYDSGGTTPTVPEDNFIGRLTAFQSYLAANGMAAKPLIFTEFGWQSSPSVDWQAPVSEATHADHVARSNLFLLGLAKPSTFNIVAAENFCLKLGVDGYTFLGENSLPRMPYVAFSRVVREVSGYTGTRKYLNMGGNLYAFTAAGSGGTLLALWTKTGTTAVRLPDTATAARSLYGHAVSVGSTGSKQVTASVSTTYVTVGDAALGESAAGAPFSITRGGTKVVEFTVMIAPSQFSLSGTTLSVTGTAPTGTFHILGKAGSVWKDYTVTVN